MSVAARRWATGLVIATAASAASAASTARADAVREITAGELAGGERDDGMRPDTEQVARAAARAQALEAAGDRARAADAWLWTCAAERYATVALDPPACKHAAPLIATDEQRAFDLAQRGGFEAWLNLWEPAIKDIDAALAICHENPAWFATRVAHLYKGGIAVEMGEYDRAATELDRLATLAQAHGDLLLLSYVHTWRSRIAMFTGDLAAARDESAQGVALAERARSIDALAIALWMRGTAELEAHRDADAIPFYDRSLAASEQAGNFIVVFIMHMNLANAWADLGDVARARPHMAWLRAAQAAGHGIAVWNTKVDYIDGMVLAAEGRMPEAAARFRSGIVDGVMSHYMNIDGALRLAEVLRTLGDKPGARAAYEDAIARVEADRPHTPEDQRASFLSKHGAVYRALIDLLWQTDGAAAAERAFALAEASRARTLLDALRASGVDGATARPRTPAEIRAALAPGELLLVFVTATDATYGFVVSRDALRWTRLAGAGGVAALTARVAFFRKQVVEAESDDAVTSAGGALYQDLLAPLIDDAPAGTLLVIAPDGPLHLLPFDALWRAASHELIAERFDVAMTPSGSLLADPGTAAAPRAILAVADPPDDAGLGPLPDSAREVDDALAKLDGDELLLRGRDATEARLKAASPGAYAILHFATHATVDDALPLRSALVLGGGGGDDGRLTAAEIYRMQLRTGVVVLSACQSAVGDVAGAEGPMSLARAFLHAGAGSVVATLWQIEDRGAARLMDRFYDELASGDATARALGEAKRAMIAAGAPPRSWAAFVATGLPSRAPGVTARARGGLPIRWGLAAALVIAVAFVGIGLVGIRRARNR